jgi:hypothetical protein
MYFCTYDHYDENQSKHIIDYEENTISECFICFEIKNIDELEPIKLQKQTLYMRECDCDSYVHKICLKKWFDINKNCPICRKIIRNNNMIIFIFNNYIPYGANIYLFISSIDKNFYKVLLVYIFVYLIIEICLKQETYIILKHRRYNNYNESHFH